MDDKKKRAIEKHLTKIEKSLGEIRILLSERDNLPILKTDYGDLLVPRRVTFCEHCGDIDEEIGYAEVDPEDYKADPNCRPNVTWCFTCGESCGDGEAEV